MKLLNIIQLGFVFAGCFLGAGFVSGQELWQFFGIYGKNGFMGMLLAIILFFIFGYIVLALSQKTGIILMDEIVIPQKHGCPKNSECLRNFIGFIQVFFIIGIYIIMCAGAGALINQLLGLHIIVGSSIFCFLVCFVSLKGIRGVINVFSLFVPPLILCAVIIGIYAVNKNGFSFVIQENQDTIFKNPAISAIVYVSYNFFGSIGILAPVAQKYKNYEKYKSKKFLVAGTATGCLILTLISFCVLMAMNTDRESTFSQLPMLFIAEKANIFVGFAYAFFLLGAMFSTSLSSLVAVCEYVKEKYNFQRKKSAILTIFLSFLACLLSLVGFDKLIGTIYPLCGIFGLFALVAIAVHYIKVEK